MIDQKFPIAGEVLIAFLEVELDKLKIPPKRDILETCVLAISRLPEDPSLKDRREMLSRIPVLILDTLEQHGVESGMDIETMKYGIQIASGLVLKKNKVYRTQEEWNLMKGKH